MTEYDPPPEYEEPPDSREAPSRLPPQDIDAEACVVGACILDPRCIQQVQSLIGTEDFYRPAHQTIWRAVSDMHDRGEPIDLVTFKNELVRLGQLDAVGGIDYIVSILEGVPNAGNADYYAKIVRDKSMLRSAIVVGQELVRDGFAAQQSAGELIADTLLDLDRIAQRSVGQAWQRMDARQAVDLVLQQTRQPAKQRMVKFGYSSLDLLVGGLRGGDYAILAGTTSSGKTNLALNFVRQICAAGSAVYVLSAEMRPDQLMQRLVAMESGVPMWKIRGGRIAESMTDGPLLEDAAESIRQWDLHIDCVSRSPRAICTAVKTFMHDIGRPVDLVVLDYFQKLRSGGKYVKRYEMFSEVSNELKQLALTELNVPILAISQFGRDVGKEGRLPSKYDLKETGEIENDADLIMLLHNSGTTRRESGRILDEIWLKVDKQRQGMVNCWPSDGGRGAIAIGMDSSTLTMQELEVYDG